MDSVSDYKHDQSVSIPPRWEPSTVFRRVPSIAAESTSPYTQKRFHVLDLRVNERDMHEITPLNAAQGPFYAGIDVGGTNTKIGLVDDFGRTVAYQSIPTAEEDGPADLIRRVSEAVARIRDEAGIGPRDLVAAGLGTPGPMDIPRGLILDPVNLPHWRNFPVRDELARVTGLPVSFTNDANAAAYGEFWVGSGRQSESMIMLTLGTGVGGGIIVGGLVVEGVNSFGAECGHVIVDSRPDARLCVWGGGRGELEAYASAS
ncbi:MAG: ROK family protein, partial [Planctomycetes bacterium]|nr:ROK family protein [Planctomycetota bacterium]